MTMTSYIIKHLGKVNYEDSWHKMQTFTENRTESTPDEIWILEHNPVFTLGLAGKKEHILFTEHNIPVIKCDRGGQVTYHGPGQLIVYTLINLKRANLSIRQLVERMEQGIINYLAKYGIKANGDRNAPGVYIEGKKIASLGLKVRKGCTYHGLSFNIAMDTTPFTYINVCGYSDLQVTQLRNLININSFESIANEATIFITESVYSCN